MLNVLPKVKSVKFGYGSVGSGYLTRIDPSLPKEGYHLTLNEEGVTIAYSEESGKFYAEKTLEQIKSQYEDLPCLEIEDAPKFSFRGFMIDCSRHFFTVAELKKQIKVMACLKLNKFHWHLTDDQGWRIEIKKYPRLTEIGSVRSSTRNDGVPVKGFYTQEDIKEVVAFCAERHIEVIPEIDMPGHFTAAIAAYPWIGCRGEQLLVSEHFGIHHEIACAGKDEVIGFCKDVIKEVSELFNSDFIHLGGDEALKMRWLDCPECQKRMTGLGLNDEEELQGWFMNEIIAYVNTLGKKAILWNDGAMGGNIEGEVYVQYWKKTAQCTDAAVKMAKSGKGVIYSATSYFYLDYPYGLTSLKKTYNFKIEKNLADNIAGLEAPLWTEYIGTVDKLEEMAYPRLFAAADRAWSESADYTDFALRMDSFLPYIKRKYPIKVNPMPNPAFVKGKIGMIKFFLNAWDKTLREGSKYYRENYRKWKAKYGNKRKNYR